MNRTSIGSALSGKWLVALLVLIPSLGLSQNWRDTLQYARISGMGLSMDGYVGDSLANAKVEAQIRSHLDAEKWKRTEASYQHLQSVFVVTSDKDTGNSTLRKAIDSANANPGLDMITFNISPAGTKTITPLTFLPNILDPVIIDGTTQPGGTAGKPKIEINCSGQGAFNALTIYAGNSTVRGLVINRLATGGSGIVLLTNGGNIIEGNFFGTDITGTSRVGNIYNGVISYSPNNRIGGTTPEKRNVFAGQGLPAIGLGNGSSGTLLQGNFIGTDVTGSIRLGNVGNGILVQGSFNDTIGGTIPGARNIISGCEGTAVTFAIVGTGPTGTRGVQVLGNYIGTDVTGMIDFGNPGTGILVRNSPNNRIGGTIAEARNVIAGHGNSSGIRIDQAGSTNNLVQGNFIGTKANGTDTLGNSAGITIDGSPNNIIGGTELAAKNIISGNFNVGVTLANSGASGNKIQGNSIGTDLNGGLDLGNGSVGVFVLNASQDSILFNLIAYNKSTSGGVFVQGGTSNLILGNSIYSNRGLGIDLAPRGLARNDSLDGDVGANNLQNFPLLDSAAILGGNITIHGRFNGKPNTQFQLDFYSTMDADSSHFGEGQNYLSIGYSAVTDAGGNANFFVTLPFVPSIFERYITATARDVAGNTSEFSQALGYSDSDGDGIMDPWETQGWGIDVNADSTVDLDLYALGARPDHKDLFVEVDAMTGLAPQDTTLQRVADAFAGAPNSLVHNPDGTDGIKLHYQLDDTTLTLTPWPTNAWSRFDSVKTKSFGTQAQRTSTNSRHILDAKKLVYRYGIYAHSLDTNGTSGMAEDGFEQGCNDFMVTLGTWTVPGGTADQKAGTFMHEFGHTLGRRHGGGDHINYKPNFISIMSYTWQTPFKWANTWRLNYSPVALPALVESQLNEHIGLNPPPGAYSIISVPFSGPGRGLNYARLSPGDSVDWDSSGTITASANADLNIFRSDLSPSPAETLYSYVDWSNLLYNFRNGPDFADQPVRKEVFELKEMNLNDFNQLDNLPPPKPFGVFLMDGLLDTSATLLASNAGINLYARYKSGQLYVATNSAQSQGGDMFIFISDTQNLLRSAPSGKTGQVAAWTVYLGSESTDNSSGWSNATEAPLTNITVDTAGTVLEGVIDIELLYGRVPTELFLAIGKYGTNAGGALLAQVPIGNGDGNIDPPELFRFSESPLPIQLASFSATFVPGVGVRLAWLTLSELNNYGFEVQRRQEGETVFESLPNSFIPGHGTTTEPHHYAYVDSTGSAGHWLYRLKQIDLDGSVWYGPYVAVEILASVAEDVPREFALQQNHPNPFNPSTTIRYEVPVQSRVAIKVYDILGREVATLVDEVRPPGRYRIEWNAALQASGVYFYRMTAGAFSVTKRLMIVK